ncbi:ATP-binding cassette domain-containing protein [Pseudonocardia sp. MH-G8]|uniref:ABC transporter ATP-binding protein n=1 Tax=Pseudonocardia sp. MH-G8 TaxID=1854588 RepID=UPI0018E9F663|nr:ATP-binding cassette domain-containing protein [Pseudonocardia sp. MH-G8]
MTTQTWVDDPQAHQRGAAAAIVLDEAHVQFERRRHEPLVAVNEVSFAIPRGKVVCLLGPNGSGKTTTVNLICGLLRPTSGTVRVFGHDPVRNRRQVLESLAVVPQETALYDSLNAHENLVFHGRYYGVDSRQLPERIDSVLDLVQLTDRAKDRVGTYSGGMQRRLALARALLTEPQALLLDEPTLGVDVHSRAAIWDQIRALADQGMSVLLTTNYMEEAEQLSDHIVILDHGTKVVEGTLAELKDTAGKQRLLLHFADEESAVSAAQLIERGQTVARRDATVTVELSEAREALALIQRFEDTPSGLGGRLVRFELKESNLQDVFLQFTGRALRD